VPEPLHEQISQALVARLGEISEDGGYSFWYTPDRVDRVLDWENANIDDSLTHTLFLKPLNDTVTEGTTGDATWANVKGEASFEVLIVKKDDRADRNPQTEDADMAAIGPTVISRCVADVRTVLLREPTLDGLVWNVANGDTTADYSFNLGGPWLAAVVGFTVVYDGLIRKA